MSTKRAWNSKKKNFLLWVLSGLWTFIKTTLGLLWEIIKLPYYLVKGSYWLAQRINRLFEAQSNKKSIKKKRNAVPAHYTGFKVIKTLSGEYKNWEEKIMTSDSTIGIILGARGSGKTAFGLKMIENIYAKTGKKICAMGFPAAELPSWIEVVESTEALQNNSFVLIDEGGILFSSRSAMTKPNKLLSKLMLISRHKNLSIIFISQNSSNLEINILRQADYLVLKKSSLLQHEFERKIVQKLYEDNARNFEAYKEMAGLGYIHGSEFRGFVSNALPSFWKSEISKAFR